MNKNILILILVIILLLGVFGGRYLFMNNDSLDNTSSENIEIIEKKQEKVIEVVNEETQDIIDKQKNSGPTAILEVNCEDLKTEESKKYCNDEKIRVDMLLKKISK